MENPTFKYEKIELLVCIYEISRELVFKYGISRCSRCLTLGTCRAEAIRVSGAVHESFFEHCLLLGVQITIPIPGGYLLRSFFPSYLSVLGAHQWSWVKWLLCTGRVVKEAPAQVDWEGCKSLVPGPEYQEWYLTLVGEGQTRGPRG